MQRFTAESSRAEQQAEESVYVPYPPLQIVNSVPREAYSMQPKDLSPKDQEQARF